MRSKLLLLILLAFNIISGQTNYNPNIFPASPDVTKIQKYGEIPVSNYVGTANVSVPIYTIVEDGFEMPITLNYDTRGIKVEEESSRIGLGWSLGLQGIISREIIGKDDFIVKGYTRPVGNIPDIRGIMPEEDKIMTPGLRNRMLFSSIKNLQPYMAGENLSDSNEFEPDIFYYNLPGISGKFTLNRDGTTVLKNYDHNIKIETISVDVYGVAKNWIITTPNGVKYYFDIREHSFSDYAYNTGPIQYDSAWYLTKVETIHGHIINFNYNSTTSTPGYQLPSTYLKMFASDHFNHIPEYLTMAPPASTFNISLISTIDFPNGTIRFLYDDRIDLFGEKKLTSIEVKNKAIPALLIKHFFLKQDYFTSNVNSNNTPVTITGGSVLLNTALSKRLKLNSIQEKDINGNIIKEEFFEYNENFLPQKNSNAQDHWGFFNNALTNMNLLPDIILDIPIYEGNNYGLIALQNYTYLKHFNGSNKEVNPLYCNAFSLKKIIYPTKGWTEFEYESNTYDPSTSFVNDINASSISIFKNNNINGDRFNYCGGLRIKKIINYDNKGNTYTKRYEYQTIEDRNQDGIPENYSFGKLLSRPRYFSNTYDLIPCNGSSSGSLNFSITMKDKPSYCNEYIGYDKVVIYDEFNSIKNGYSIFEYINKPTKIIKISLLPGFSFSDLDSGFIPPIEKSVCFNYKVNIVTPGLRLLSEPNVFPVNSPMNRTRDYGFDWKPEGIKDDTNNDNGLIKTESNYKFENNNYKLINTKDYQYNAISGSETIGIKIIEPPQMTTTFCSFNGQSHFGNVGGYYPICPTDVGPCQADNYAQMGLPEGDVYNIVYKTLNGTTYLPSQITDTNYFNNNTFVETTINNEYSIGGNLYSQIITNSAGDNHETRQYYPQDYEMSSQPFVSDMITKWRVNTPLRTEIYNNDNKVSDKLTVFAKDVTTSNLLQPKNIFTAKFPNSLAIIVNVGNMEKKITYNQYDIKGNITQYTPENAPPVSIIWGYNKTQPIAKIENATNSQIASALGVPDLNSVTESSLTAINNLRTNTTLSNIMVTTFTYIPLVGISSITDPKGDKTTYIYDEFNRLKSVKDKDENVLSENEYHYKN